MRIYDRPLITRFAALSVPTLALVLGCSTAGAPTLDTGLPRTVPANEVTPAEAVVACGRYEVLANQSLGVDVQRRLGCTIAGIASQVGGGATCNQTLGTCLANAGTTGTPLDFNCESAVSFAPSGCSATIGELEDCVNAVSAGLNSFTGRINCGLIQHLDQVQSIATDAVTVANPDTYPACASLSTECLGLLGWTASTLGPITNP